MNETITPIGGLNLDDDLRYLKNTDSRDRVNVIYETDGDGGLLRPILGNTLVSYRLPTGVNRVVGQCEDKENNSLVYFVYNSLGNHYILEYKDEEVSAILRNKSFLNLTSSTYVDCAVVDGKLLFTISGQSPKKLNIERAKTMTQYEILGADYFNGTYITPTRSYVYVAGKGMYSYTAGTGRIIRTNSWWDDHEDMLTFITNDLYWDIDNDISQIEEYKSPPLSTVKATPSVSDEELENAMTEKSFLFSYRYVYKDNEASVYAKPSFAITNPYKAGEEYADSFNVVDIILQRGNNDVDRIEVVGCDANTKQWYKIGEIEQEDFNGEDSYTFRYNGMARYEAIAPKDIDKPYDAVPLEADTVAVVENRVVHGNITEGFDVGEVTLTVETVESDEDGITVLVTEIYDEDFSSATKTFTTDRIEVVGRPNDIAPDGAKIIVEYGEVLGTSRELIGQVTSTGAKTYRELTEELTDVLNSVYQQTVDADRNYYAISRITSTRCFINIFKGLRLECNLNSIPLTRIPSTFTGAITEGVITDGGEPEIDLYDYLTPGEATEPEYATITFEDITVGTENPSCQVTGVVDGSEVPGDELTTETALNKMVTKTYNWEFDYGDTGLTLETIVYDDDGGLARPIFFFSGTAAEGTIYVKAEATIMTSGNESEWSPIYVGTEPEGEDYTIKYNRDYSYEISTDTGVADSVNRTYKSGSSYEGGIVYYDGALRKSTVTNKVEFTIPYRDSRSTKTYLDVTIEGEAPSWAKYYSFAHTASSISDSAMIDVFGGGMATEIGLTGDTNDLIYKLELSNISYEYTDDEILYWQWVESTKKFQIYNNTERLSTHLVAEGWFWDNGANRMTSEYVDDTYVYRLPIIQKNNSNITGYVLLKPLSTTSSQTDIASQQIQTILQIVKDQDENYLYEINIAPYINSIKNNLKPEQNVFTPQIGDSVRIISHGGTVVTNSPVLIINKIKEGKVIKSENDIGYYISYYIYCTSTTDDYDFSEGGLIEIYRRNQSSQSLFFEEPNLRGITQVGDSYYHTGEAARGSSVAGETVTIKVDNGDAYIRPRVYLDTDGNRIQSPVYVEDFRVTDTFDSKVWTEGRTNVYAKSEEKTLKSALRWSGRLLEETQINNLCSFDGADIRLLEDDNGGITKIVSQPNGMRVLQERRATTIDVGRQLITRPDGREELVAVSNFIGSIRPSRNRWGCSNPESVVDVNGTVYYMDKVSGQFISDGANGQFPISGKVFQGEYANDYKMQTYFDDIAATLRESTKNRIYVGYDDKYKMLFVRLDEAGLREDAVRGTVGSTVRSTVGFHVPSRRWLSYYSIPAEGFIGVGQHFYSFRNGTLWEHNTGGICTFYNKQYNANITLTSVENPLQMKLYDALWLRLHDITLASLPNDFIEITIPADDTYNEKYSVITKGMLVKNEGEYRASILRNMKTRATTASNIDLYNGDPMRGYVAEIELNLGTSDFRLHSVNVVTK